MYKLSVEVIGSVDRGLGESTILDHFWNY